MSISALISHFSVPTKHRVRLQKRKQLRRLLVESLEPRNLLAAFTVNSLLDGPINSADDATVFTLREATHASNLSIEADTIVFAPALTASGPATITFTGGFTALSDVTIVGPGAHLLSVNGNANGRIFRIDSAFTASLSGLTLRNGSASQGGAIENLGTLAISDASFESNTTSGDGGAIYNTGTLTVNGSTFTSNTANLSGGAIGVDPGGIATIVNSTLSGNSAQQFGGAIYVDGSTVTIIHSTIVSNQAQSTSGGTGTGGGISNFGTVTLHNTIVAGNTRFTNNVANDLTNMDVQSTSSNNLIGRSSTSGGLTHGVNGNILGINGSGQLPLSSILNTTLANNGGNTLTHALLPNSPAIDAAGINAYPTDILSDSPLVYYPMNETSGTTIDNAASAAPTFNAAIIPTGIQLGQPSLPGLGTAPRFVNGSPDSSIAVPNLGTSSTITIEAWVNPSSRPASGDFDVIFNSRNFSSGAAHLQFTETGLLQFSLSGIGFGVNFGTAANFPLNSWTHIAVTYDNATDQAQAFANGVSLGTNPLVGNQDIVFGLADIGSWNDNGTIQREFDGFIDEVAIYPTVLSSARIQSHYREGFAPVDQRGEARFRDVPNINDPGAKSDIGAVEAGRSIIDLSNLGPVGTTIFGADARDYSGYSVSSAGDVNGDGFDDLLIGAFRADASGNAKDAAGDSYVIFGKSDWSTSQSVDLANLGSAGINIFGADAFDQSGTSVSSAGDVNGDGFDDLIIGARYADASGNAKSYAGDSYVIFGKSDWSTTPSIDLANLGPAGITIFGADQGDRSGSSVSSAGDVNGDGFDDFVIGAYKADALGNAKYGAGDSYVIFGAASLPATIDLANLGSAGITLFGADADDQSGLSVSSAGDVNGDGFDDLIIGAFRADASGNAKSFAGDSYVIFGKSDWSTTPSIDLANLGSAGITIFGADAGDRSGLSVSSAGDVNGDGFDDLLIGARFADASGNAKSIAGDNYVIFGKSDWSTNPSIDLANLGSAGITIFGADAGDQSGFSVSSAGDVNGDGFDDLLIGAGLADASGNTKDAAGDSYVIFGKSDWSTTPSIDLANLGSAGITIFGADAFDYSGISVSSAGDVNGDGFDDLIIGANGADASGNLKSNAGESYLIFGGNGFTNSIAAANLGTNAANNINGAAGAQILNGADGNDTLIGNGGADILLGGRGNDILAVSDLNFKRIVGGNGLGIGNNNDTLRLDGSGLSLNLTTIPDNRIVGIETIDITGSGNNTLTLNQREVLNLSDKSNTLTVIGNAGDRVVVDTRWTQGTDSGGFQIFTNGAATLRVSITIPVSITIIDLTNIGLAGTIIFGAGAVDQSGYSVSDAGDVNGDGFDDLIIGASIADASGNAKSSAGDSYVIFGKSDWSTTPSIDLANLGSAGITIFGADAFDYSGNSVSSAGDVNGDGFDDLIIGALGADASGNVKTFAGDSYVIFGKSDWSTTPSIDLANLGSAGISIFGADASDRSGISVSSAGDVNGDGFDDLIIGAYRAAASGNAKSNAGDSYVIFGKSDWSTTPSIDLANLGSAGITIFGADASDRSGISVSSAGDVNGDGFDDLIIGARYADASGNAKDAAGDSYMIFGKSDWSTTPSIDLANLGSAGITIFGADASDQSGISVSSAGDVNGDGFDDLIIGAYFADASGNAKSNAGDSYVIFGKSDWSTTPSIDLANLGSAGITIFGADASDGSGISVSSAGDVNGDGFDDLLIGAFRADASGNAKSSAGDSYVIFGKSDWSTTPSIDLANLGPAGITIFGADAIDQSGNSVSSAGDVNGDGFDDLLIGANLADGAGNLKFNAGESYLIFGGNGFTNSILPANLGGLGANALLGDAAANRINGAGGDDVISGGGGADVLLGGQGNDIFVINDASFQRIVGGTGRDSLWLNNPTNVGFTLNLTAIPDNLLQGIEEIDITGSGNNTLTLSYREVLNISGESNTLVVHRNVGDVVNIGAGWTPVASELIQGVGFNVYKQGAALLKVQALSSVVLNRQVFYNRSMNATFGNGTGNPNSAIDPTRVALLPGQASTSANVTNYIHGINGIVIDANVPTSVTVADLAFATWNGIAAGGFAATVATPTLTVIANGGVGGSTRLKIEFNNGALVNTWLRVTLKGNVSTGLAADDVFYFGSAAGEVDRNMSDVRVNASDLEKLRRSISTRAVAISSIFDIDKDGRVSAFDYAALRQRMRSQAVLRRIVV